MLTLIVMPPGRSLRPGTVAARLSSGQISESLDWIGEVGHGGSILANATAQEYAVAFNALLALWSRASRDREYWSQSGSDQAADKVLSTGTLAIECLTHLFAVPDSWRVIRDVIPEGLRLLDFTEPNTDGNLDQTRAFALLAAISTCIAGQVALESLMRADFPYESFGTMEAMTHRYGEGLARMAISGHPSLRTLAGDCLMWCHSNWRRLYSDIAPRWDPEFSLIQHPPMKLGELAALAKRTEPVMKRYGRFGVAGRFEQQLALVANSLGCIVVQTRRFERSVDIVCFSENPKATFLIEAKTTARPYSLPTSDQRALVEYVSAIRDGLGVLPALQLVILVGPEPAGTLQSKLRQLSLEMNLPIRYLRAADLATVRRHIVGPFPLGGFLSALKNGQEIVEKQVISGLVSDHRRERQLVLDLVNFKLRK